MTFYNVLILAGKRYSNDPLAELTNNGHKCLLKAGGVPLLLHVIKAIEGANFSSINISIENEDIISDIIRECNIHINSIRSSRTIADSLVDLFDNHNISLPLLITTADNALLTSDIVGFFIARAQENNADLCIGVVNSDVILESFPKAKRTFIKFSDASYTGCNLFAFNNISALKVIEFWRKLESKRKRPWLLIKSLGIKFLVKYLMGNLSLYEALNIVGKRLGVKIHAIEMPYAEIAIDVDKPDDLRLVDEIIRDKLTRSA